MSSASYVTQDAEEVLGVAGETTVSPRKVDHRRAEAVPQARPPSAEPIRLSLARRSPATMTRGGAACRAESQIAGEHRQDARTEEAPARRHSFGRGQLCSASSPWGRMVIPVNDDNLTDVMLMPPCR
jgi:hypothetical protein